MKFRKFNSKYGSKATPYEENRRGTGICCQCCSFQINPFYLPDIIKKCN